MKLIHDKASPLTLNIFRIAIFGYWLREIVKDPIEQLQYLPSSVLFYTGFLIRFLPPTWKEALLSPEFLYTLKYSLIILILLVIFKVALHITGLIVCVLLTLYQGLVRSFGHMGHTELLVLYAAFLIGLFAFADWIWLKNSKRDDKDINLNSIPFIMFLFFFCMTYSFIGIYRLVKGGTEFFQSDIMYYWIAERIDLNDPFKLQIWEFLSENKFSQFALKKGFIFMTLVEASAPFILVSKWYRYFFIIAVLGMHILNGQLLGIYFRENMFLMILFFDVTVPFNKRSKIK